MFETLNKILKSIQIYKRYFNEAFVEIYFYYISPTPLIKLMKKLALANRSLRVLWAPPSNGRKPLNQKVVDLIVELKTLNPKWGAQKISHELAKIGYKVSKKTVLKYLEIHGLKSPNLYKGSSWTEFIENHKFKIGIDFTSLISILGKQLFIFVIIDLDSRKLIFINVTCKPNSEWITQQFRNAFLDFETYPSLCICDNDTIFHHWFETMLKESFAMKLRRTPYKSPHKNGITERFHLSLKSEAFDNIVPLGRRHALKICNQYQDYYNNYRPHQGICGKLPNRCESKSEQPVSFSKEEHLDGKIISFEPKFSNTA